MLCGKKLRTQICQEIWGQRCSVSHKNLLKIDFLSILLGKKEVMFFSSKDANISKSYYMQYFKQTHKIIATSDEKKSNIFFVTNSTESPISRISCGKRAPLPPPLFYNRLLFIIFIPHIIYFLYKNVRTLKFTPVEGCYRIQRLLYT